MLAVLHGVNRHRHMQLPRGADIDEVDVVAPAKLFPALFTAVGRGCGEIPAGKDLLRLLDPVGIEVAERLDLDAVEVGETLHGARTAHAQPDESDPHDGYRIGRQPQHRMLALGTGRGIENNHAVHDAVTLRRRSAGRKKERSDDRPRQKGKFLHLSVVFRCSCKNMKYFEICGHLTTFAHVKITHHVS